MFEKLEQAIGYTFRDKSLLKLAMTHPSYAGETHVHNQRLEFLGDAVHASDSLQNTKHNGSPLL